MKILKALVPVILIAALLCSCSQNQASQTEDTSKKITCDNSLIQQGDKDKEAIVALAKRADDIYEFGNIFAQIYDPQLIEMPAETAKNYSSKYYRVTMFNSIAELREYIEGMYSKNIADQYFISHIYNEEGSFGMRDRPYIVESEGEDGNLYVYADDRFAAGAKRKYVEDSLKIVLVEDDRAVIELTSYDVKTPDKLETKRLTLKKEDGNWVFDEIIK